MGKHKNVTTVAGIFLSKKYEKRIFHYTITNIKDINIQNKCNYD